MDGIITVDASAQTKAARKVCTELEALLTGELINRDAEDWNLVRVDQLTTLLTGARRLLAQYEDADVTRTFG